MNSISCCARSRLPVALVSPTAERMTNVPLPDWSGKYSAVASAQDLVSGFIAISGW